MTPSTSSVVGPHRLALLVDEARAPAPLRVGTATCPGGAERPDREQRGDAERAAGEAEHLQEEAAPARRQPLAALEVGGERAPIVLLARRERLALLDVGLGA